MFDYNGISLYRKVPYSYQKLAHNYGSTDYKELDPRINNLFKVEPPKKPYPKRLGKQPPILVPGTGFISHDHLSTKVAIAIS
jgi:hypothetical protein